MRAFSSHRGRQDSKMRFLIVSAILACATAAPSHIVPVPVPVAFPAVRVAYPAPVPIPAGDIQAAAIDAQVKLADLAQDAADKARAVNDQVAENLNVQAYSNVDTANEKVAEEAWAVEDKKWQALGAIQTAEAQLDGAIASNAPVLAKSAVAGPYVAAVAPLPVVSSVPVYPGYIAPEAKSVSSEAAQVEPEAPKAEGEKAEAEAEAVNVEASAKAAEPEKTETPAVEGAKAVEAAADKLIAAYNAAYVAPTFALTKNFVGPVVYPPVPVVQPLVRYVSPVHPIVPVVGPTIVSSHW